MKPDIQYIVGKNIVGVVVKEQPGRQPHSMVFLVFDDDTYFEFYSLNSLVEGGGPRPGSHEDVLRYFSRAKVVGEYGFER